MHGSAAKLQAAHESKYGDQRPPRVAVCVGEDGDSTLEFCILEDEEEICGIDFTKGLRKSNRSERRFGLDNAIAVTFDSGEAVAERPCGGGEGNNSLRLNDVNTPISHFSLSKTLSLSLSLFLSPSVELSDLRG
nr:hypothetical protein CFP56_05944 [Quercus suber]